MGGRKNRIRRARYEKARKHFPRPISLFLRPIVHGQTLKYNSEKKLGRGFSLEELKTAGISAKLAPTIGIAVDHRRKNHSQNSLYTNVAVLKEYKNRVVLFPNKSKRKRTSACGGTKPSCRYSCDV